MDKIMTMYWLSRLDIPKASVVHADVVARGEVHGCNALGLRTANYRWNCYIWTGLFKVIG